MKSNFAIQVPASSARTSCFFLCELYRPPVQLLNPDFESENGGMLVLMIGCYMFIASDLLVSMFSGDLLLLVPFSG